MARQTRLHSSSNRRRDQRGRGDELGVFTGSAARFGEGEEAGMADNVGYFISFSSLNSAFQLLVLLFTSAIAEVVRKPHVKLVIH